MLPSRAPGGGYQRQAGVGAEGTDDYAEGHAWGGVQGQWRDTPILGWPMKCSKHFQNCHCRATIHKTLRITPVMEAGISVHAWTLEEIV